MWSWPASGLQANPPMHLNAAARLAPISINMVLTSILPPWRMSAHISAPNVTGADIPATMSSVFLQDKLRRELGYQQIIITNAMEMGAITMQYSNAEAAFRRVLTSSYARIILSRHLMRSLQPLRMYTISQARLDESVRRILLLKKQIRNESNN